MEKKISHILMSRIALSGQKKDITARRCTRSCRMYGSGEEHSVCVRNGGRARSRDREYTRRGLKESANVTVEPSFKGRQRVMKIDFEGAMNMIQQLKGADSLAGVKRAIKVDFMSIPGVNVSRLALVV